MRNGIIYLYIYPMYLNPSIFPNKLIKHLTRFDYMYWKNRHHFVRKFRFDSNMASHVGSTIRDNRSFRNETWRRRRDGYGVPYGLAYQRGRGTRTSRVPLISRQHAPLIISLITATWTWRGGRSDSANDNTPSRCSSRDRTLTSRFDCRSDRDLMMADNACAQLVAYLRILNDSSEDWLVGISRNV